MDPDTCLSEIRSIVLHVNDPDEPDAVEDRFERLVELVDGLDTWMSVGGYPPGAWQPEARLRTQAVWNESMPAGGTFGEDGVTTAERGRPRPRRLHVHLPAKPACSESTYMSTSMSTYIAEAGRSVFGIPRQPTWEVSPLSTWGWCQ